MPADRDNVLTNLVIPVAPLGTGMIAEIGATSIMFRQGIGRLIRREGLPLNRRLHFIDARIHESQWRSVLRPVFQALCRYPRQRTV